MPAAGPTWAIVVAAGRGTRFGGLKQLADLGGRPVLAWSVAAAATAADGVVVVGPPGADLPALPGDPDVVPGGETRSDSVRAGLAVVPPDAARVVVHDAARPFATAGLFARVLAALEPGVDGAVPALPVTDTVKRVEGGAVAATLERSGLVAVQTPQAFAAPALRSAHASGAEATDDAALVEGAGGRVVTVEGEPGNGKITTGDDLEEARRRVAAPAVRVGHGFDVHPFSPDPGRPLVLGGVRVEGARGLAGHSDADAVSHAVADALLGAAGLGDLGTLFPDTDERWAGADSVGLLAQVVARVHEAGWRVGNVDCTMVAESPRLAPWVEPMRRRLEAVVAAPVSVKPKRAEGLGALGRAEGVACFAVAVLCR